MISPKKMKSLQKKIEKKVLHKNISDISKTILIICYKDFQLRIIRKIRKIINIRINNFIFIKIQKYNTFIIIHKIFLYIELIIIL